MAQSMTVANIMGGFKVTGVYPLDRHVLVLPQQEPQELSQETGLRFIPLYSLCKRHPSPVDADLTLTNSGLIESSILDTPTAAYSNSTFTEEEVALFERRYENGYDMVGDSRYREWLCKSHPNTTLLMPFTSKSVQRYLDCPACIGNHKLKSCGRALTSVENMKIIAEKEKLKKQKEEEKRKREEERRKKSLLKSLKGIMLQFTFNLTCMNTVIYDSACFIPRVRQIR